jgi:hypothetical protein
MNILALISWPFTENKHVNVVVVSMTLHNSIRKHVVKDFELR